MGGLLAFCASGHKKDHNRRDEDQYQNLTLTQKYAEHCCFLLIRTTAYGRVVAKASRLSREYLMRFCAESKEISPSEKALCRLRINLAWGPDFL